MKTPALLILSLLALGVAGTACNKGNKVENVTTAMPTGPVELKVKWPADRHGIQTRDMQMTMDMTIPNMPGPMKQETIIGHKNALTVVQDGGRRALELKFLATKMSVTSAGKSVLAYDSTTNAPDDKNPVAGTLGKVIGAKIDFILDESNHITSVEGADALQQQLSANPAADPAGTLKAMFSGDALKLDVDFARNLSGTPVQPGDTWPVHAEYPLGQAGVLIVDVTNTLSGWEKHNGRYCAKIDADGTISSKPDSASPDAPMKLDFHDGTSNGTMLFDVDMGMFVEGTIYLDMKVDITIKPRPGMPKPMHIQGTMHEAITSKFELQ